MESETPQSDRNELDRLNRDYPGWRVWRSRRSDTLAGWVATNRDPRSPYDPTLHGDTSHELEGRLRNPPLRMGRPLLDGEEVL